jgi:isochorismate hydrolase
MVFLSCMVGLSAMAGYALDAGTWDAAVVDELDCGPDDLVIYKARFDAFPWTSPRPAPVRPAA